MRLFFIFIVLVSSIVESLAQSPQGFNYQAVVRDKNGNIRANQAVQFIFEIRDATGKSVYKEVASKITNSFGLVDGLVIGRGASSNNFSNIDWGAGTYFLNVKVDGEDTGTSQLLSVPYALYSLKSGSGGGRGKDGIGISSTVDNGDGTFTLNYTDGSSFTTVNMVGKDGESAYDLWLASGGLGTTQDFLLSLKGEKGEKGEDGLKGEPGNDGAPGRDAEITGAASSVAFVDLDTSRVLVSNIAGKIAVSGISSIELSQLDKIRSNVQDQIDLKQDLNKNLTSISSMDPKDKIFIVGDGTDFIPETPTEARASLLLGDMAIQNSDNIQILGGSISGIDDLAVEDGGTGASTPEQAWINLNVDSAGTDNSTDVTLSDIPSNYLTLTDQEITVGVVPIELGGTASTSADGARANLRLGSIATQDSTSVSIVGGTIKKITDIAISDGGTGASSPEEARLNLNVDSAGTDNSTDVTLTDVSSNYLTLTDQEITAGLVPISLGGTEATSAEEARSKLNVDSAGTDNSTDVTLTDVSSNYLTLTDQEITAGLVPITLGGTGASTREQTRINLGLIIGEDVQAFDAELASIAGLKSESNKGIQFTDSATASTFDLTDAGRALLDDIDASAQLVTLGAQAVDIELIAIAKLISEPNKGIQFTDSATAATYDLTAAGKALLDDTSSSAQLKTLGITSSQEELNLLDGLTSSTEELNLLDGISAITEAGKALLDDTTSALQLITLGITSTKDEINLLDGLSSSTDELNLLDGDSAIGESITIDIDDGFIINDNGVTKSIPALDIKNFALAGSDENLNNQVETTYLLKSTDNGKVITLNNDSDITLTIPNSFGDGFNCTIVQKGAGKIIIEGTAGVQLLNRENRSESCGQYSVIRIINIGDNIYILSGDLC